MEAQRRSAEGKTRKGAEGRIVGGWCWEGARRTRLGAGRKGMARRRSAEGRARKWGVIGESGGQKL